MANDASSPNEAAIAARRARKLMDQEGLTQAEVERMGSGGATFAAMGSGKAKRFMPKWEQSLAVGVASLNDCIVRRAHVQKPGVGSWSRIEFCGEEADAQVAKLMYEFLGQTVISLCKQYMADEGYTRYNARIGDTYKTAASHAIYDRIVAMIEERKVPVSDQTGTSLMVVKQDIVAKHFKHEGYGETKKRDYSDTEARRARAKGRADGSRVSVATQIEED
jgi:hypothetical protein